MPEISPWNQGVVAEFRANRGRVGGEYAEYRLILVHNIGARTGVQRIHPLVYLPVGEHFAVFAAKRGAPAHPDWYFNLLANPSTTVELGTETDTETIQVHVRETEGAERSRIWEAAKEAVPVYRDYEAIAGRTIPVLLLERV